MGLSQLMSGRSCGVILSPVETTHSGYFLVKGFCPWVLSVRPDLWQSTLKRVCVCSIIYIVVWLKRVYVHKGMVYTCLSIM